MDKARKVIVRGRVQGVGFRPFVFQLAEKWHLLGTVQNNMDGVRIHIEGKGDHIESFLDDLRNNAPRLARIDEVLIEPSELEDAKAFTIIESERKGTSRLVLPVDSAVCDDCLREMNNPQDFRYHYPLINCTQCGPRYTIISELPYDRPYTSMAPYKFCPQCEREYLDPVNRRHHAQPIACSECGPLVKLLTITGAEIACPDPIDLAASLIKNGHILAIKGIGGYHLCCDATNSESVRMLRKRKGRPVRPLALMSVSIDEIRRYAFLTPEEEKMLRSPEAPIVVVSKQKNKIIADEVAPGMNTLGVMLPYTPLHHLLFHGKKITSVVMTSANLSGLPIMYKDEDAIHDLQGISDYILLHKREILHPLDDSVLQITGGRTDLFRRSRGFVPDAFITDKQVHGIAAFGGQQKSTFTIGRNEQVFIGPHIGDLENIETMDHFKRELDHLLKWIDIPLETAVLDMHPSYHVRKIAKEYPFKEVLEIQHHHAHMASCMADNQLEDQVFAVILDGTGYGTDGDIWGFEVFYGDYKDFQRLAHLTYTPLPGGEKSIREPWRNAVGMMLHLLGEQGKEICLERFPKRTDDIPVLQAMLEHNVNTVMAGTCGRLFDAVSALVGLCSISTYDGEAAIKLSEFAAETFAVKGYSYQIHSANNLLEFDFTNMLEEISMDLKQRRDIREISTSFHETLVEAITACLVQLSEQHPKFSQRVVLSGGSFHNRYLKKRLLEELEKKGFKGYTHQKVPCNDGGLSYGQMMAAAAKREEI
ncbi:carbamoyltransferase HypF [Bacillus benzoevorans]|uniref:Carbamoyltransferase n=1 Tax=Bacillus benzoevorans TaxID=1456 RepID=A0A7X0HPL7_9BACI|nr:carbamoyltransferase HypF [Bacillus benzoevorans]MBB6444589.1 hydrogenase maturation protein HypF [Bacillus benzoevorans]